MYTLRVIVPKLNIRNSPLADPTYKNWVGEALLGEIVQATEKISDWYKDDSNRYYWSGGVMDMAICPNWMTDLCLPEIWHYATGKGVGVAVVDTGIAQGIDELVYDTANYFLFDPSASLKDSYGHGTNCAGLIGAKNTNGKIVGVAPDCKLYICKIAESSDFPNPDIDTVRYADAITWCADQPGIHVISVSWANFIKDKPIVDKIQKAINYAVLEKNKFVVCAIGDAVTFNDTRSQYPAACDNTLVSGAIPVEDELYPYMNASMTTAVQGMGIISYGINTNSEKFAGTSQANAIVAGIIALLLEKSNKKYTYPEIRQLLSAISTSREYTIGNATQKIPVLDGTLLFNQFKPGT